MEIDFDQSKHETNLIKHGVGFEEAAYIFLDPARLDYEDMREDYGEERRISVGEIQGRVYVVVYTIRHTRIRLISARKANERERKKYYSSKA